MSSLRREKELMNVVYARGLAAAVLAVLPQQMGLSRADIYIPVTLTVILSTAIITTLGVSYFSSKARADAHSQA
jgi:NhaP-type Na+/H+ or K+/H+ antiporter